MVEPPRAREPHSDDYRSINAEPERLVPNQDSFKIAERGSRPIEALESIALP
jgi:hypothetical protein